VWSELRERVAQYDSRTSDMRLRGGGASPSVEARNFTDRGGLIRSGLSHTPLIIRTRHGISYLLTCRARRSFPTLDLNQRAVSAGTAKHLRGDCSSISFGIPIRVTDQRSRPRIPACN
jgi:hypothetical protein